MLNKVKEWFIKEYNFDIIKFITKDENWWYYSGTKVGRPHYSSTPIVVRVNLDGNIERVSEDLRFKMLKKVMKKSEEYSEKILSPRTEGCPYNRKRFVSFNALDIEKAFEEGQMNPAWIYDKDPEVGVVVLVDELYLGLMKAKVNEEGDWVTIDGSTKLNVDRWCPLPL